MHLLELRPLGALVAVAVDPIPPAVDPLLAGLLPHLLLALLQRLHELLLRLAAGEGAGLGLGFGVGGSGRNSGKGSGEVRLRRRDARCESCATSTPAPHWGSVLRWYFVPNGAPATPLLSSFAPHRLE